MTSLALASTALHPDDIAAVVAKEIGKLGADQLLIYLADMEQRLLMPLRPPGTQPLQPLAIDGTIGGRAYRTECTVIVEDEAEGGGDGSGGTTLWLPLLDSAERIGVILVHLPAGVELVDEVFEQLEAIANLVAEIIANKAVHGDVITRTRRTQDMSLAAELRWSMLPPLTFKGRNITITGVLEPAYEIAGDTFDYAVNGDTAHLAIIDAVGHGLESARIANLMVGAYRHCRRRDLDPVETYWTMNDAMREQFGAEKFATAQVGTLHLTTGHLSWLNAGHPPPMVIRNGRRIDLVSPVCLPLGLANPAGEAGPVVTETALEPNDLVLFFTDGVVEARSVDGQEFGRDRLGDLVERAAAAGQQPAETVRILGHAVLGHQLGVLQDDATLLLLSWRGPPADDGQA